MSSITFFLIFIPFLAFILLAVNLIFAPHNPYQEKTSAFECGFHSFLGQNRTQFNISFFVFALLFLLFDLEILLVYPYIVSGYTNGIYGLVIMLIFFLVLTLGFAFELGKNALKLDSRQEYSLTKNITHTISVINSPKPNISVNLPLQCSFMFKEKEKEKENENENENAKEKTKIERFLYGVKLGIKLSLLPKPVEKFHLNPLVRILRVLGGLSFILLIGQFISKESLWFYIILPLAILQLVYIFIINMIKFCYYIYLWKNRKLEVRNSPLDKIASFGFNLVACVKGTCVFGLSGGAALGLGLSIDELLLNRGQSKIDMKVLKIERRWDAVFFNNLLIIILFIFIKFM